MAKIYGQLERAQVENLSADPSATIIGRIWYNTTSSLLKFGNGSSVKVLLTSGDVVNADIASGAAIARSKLASGTASHVLINDGTGVMSSEAQLAITRGGTGQSTATAAFNALSPVTTRGDLITRDATNNIRLAIGSANTVLKSDGTDPSWGQVVNADVSASAAIDGTKISPNFGSQNVSTTGTGSFGATTVTSLTSTGELATNKTDSSTTGSQNNVSTSGISFFRYTGAGAATITGFANGSNGKYLIVQNSNTTATNTLTLSHNSGSSSAANQIVSPTGANYVLGAGQSALLVYDSGASFWRICSAADYDAGSFTANFNQGAGVSGSGTSFTVKYVRVGKNVTLMFPNMSTMTCGTTTATFSTASSTLPASLTPDQTFVNQLVPMKTNGTVSNTSGLFYLQTSNLTLHFQRDVVGTANFTATQTNNGPLEFAMSYRAA